MNNPIGDVQEIISHLINNVSRQSQINVFTHGAHNSDILKQDTVLIILEGYVGLQRASDGVVMASFNGPYIIKLCHLSIYSDLEFTRESNFSYMQFQRDDFFSFITEKNLWRHIYYIITYGSMMVYSRLNVILNSSTYDCVKFYLCKLNSSEILKENENVCEYITLRTGCSRSGVMAILNALSKGGYIVIKRGKLKEIKMLPLKF